MWLGRLFRLRCGTRNRPSSRGLPRHELARALRRRASCPYSVSNLGAPTGCQPASPFAQHARPSPCGFLGQTFINSVVHIGRETARENDSLRAELSQPPADAMDQVTDQAVSVLNQA